MIEDLNPKDRLARDLLLFHSKHAVLIPLREDGMPMADWLPDGDGYSRTASDIQALLEASTPPVIWHALCGPEGLVCLRAAAGTYVAGTPRALALQSLFNTIPTSCMTFTPTFTRHVWITLTGGVLPTGIKVSPDPSPGGGDAQEIPPLELLGDGVHAEITSLKGPPLLGEWHPLELTADELRGLLEEVQWPDGVVHASPPRIMNTLVARPAIALGASQRGRSVRLTAASEIEVRTVEWLWWGRIALGTLSILAGREGVGKSTLAFWAAARVTRGDLPGDLEGKASNVLVAATEDSWEFTIIPRLIAADADLDRVFRVDVLDSTHDTVFETELSLPLDIGAVEEVARRQGARLLIMDPLLSRLASGLDTHKDAEVRQALEPLTAMLDRTGMVGLGLMHFNKSGNLDLLNALMGSRAFAAVARSVQVVIKDPEDPSGERLFFGTAKNNLGPDDLPTMVLTVVSATVDTPDDSVATSVIQWVGESDVRIGQVLADANPPFVRTVTGDAEAFLLRYLRESGGTAPAALVRQAATEQQISASALDRARRRAGVLTENTNSFPRTSTWSLTGGNSESGSNGEYEGRGSASNQDVQSGEGLIASGRLVVNFVSGLVPSRLSRAFRNE